MAPTPFLLLVSLFFFSFSSHFIIFVGASPVEGFNHRLNSAVTNNFNVKINQNENLGPKKVWEPSALDEIYSRLFGVKLAEPNGGGVSCAACTLVISLVQQLVVLNNETVEALLGEICDWFPNELKPSCQYLISRFGKEVIRYLNDHETADLVCFSLDLCTDKKCAIDPKSRTRISSYEREERRKKERQAAPWTNLNPKTGAVQSFPWDWIKELLQKLGRHEPLVDIDGDFFSIQSELRGSSWRGKDCNDLQKNIYPGRQLDDHISNVDHNCNGIYGTAPSGTTYEKLLCGNSQAKGTIVIGDSVGAHFHIPPEYLTARLINKTTYQNVIPLLENEFDLPQRSAWTGYEDSSPLGPVDSLYKRMNARNRCNHRDYQNIAVNGADSVSVSSDIIFSLKRNRTVDNPALVILEVVGNDICGSAHSFDTMTSSEKFKNSTLTSLHYLDSVLAPGSLVILIGLADGRILWDTLHNRTHPLGYTYEKFYDFLNCLEISPCWVWMNSNETVRNEGAVKAQQLSGILQQIVKNQKFNNFEVGYYDFPLAEVMKRWTQQGGQPWQLIEPVDGFHPSQIAHALTAQVLWEKMETEFAAQLGPVNPLNSVIQTLFGDQGGY